MKFTIDQCSFGYTKEKMILRDIALELRQGEILAILGSNGVGKTTLLKCMLGLLPWRSGETRIDGRRLEEISHKELWTSIGYVPQAKQSVFGYKVEDMVLLGRNAHLRFFEQPSPKDREIAAQVMEEIGISHLRGKSCRKISGGELQMVLIARALATEPKLLILDEPESNLDFKNQLIVLRTLERFCREKEISIIVNTHYPQHAMILADYILMLGRDGKSIFGRTQEVMTEENLEKIFSLPVKIRSVDLDGRQKYDCVIPIG